MKRLVYCDWTVPPLGQKPFSRFLLVHNNLTIFSSPWFILHCFQFLPQGLAGYPGAKGDEGPKGDDVSEIMDYEIMQKCDTVQLYRCIVSLQIDRVLCSVITGSRSC